MLQLLDRIAAHASRDPGATAIRDATCSAHPKEWNYGNLIRAVDAMAEEIAHWGRPGASVVLCSENRPEFIIAFLATLAADRTVFPIHPRLSLPEMCAAIDQSKAIGVIASGGHLRAVNERGLHSLDLESVELSSHADLRSRTTDCAGMYLQSSGTTGMPRIIRRSGRSLDAVACNVARATSLNPHDRVLAAIPLCHSYGVENGMLAPLVAGARIDLLAGFDPDAVGAHLTIGQTTVFPGTPVMIQMLAEWKTSATRAAALRLTYSAGGPLPNDVARQFALQLGTEVGQLYGSTEIGSVTFNDPTAPDYAPHSVGRAMEGVSIRILDPEQPQIDQPLPPGAEGHVAIRAPSMLDGYVGDNADEHFCGNHFLTGDLGSLDIHGNLFITGRIKLQIDVGSCKVNPLEVERACCEHGAVAECVVLPLRVSETLDRLRAVMTLAPGHTAPSQEELRAFLRQRLAAHKMPRVFEWRHALPHTPSGKVCRDPARYE